MPNIIGIDRLGFRFFLFHFVSGSSSFTAHRAPAAKNNKKQNKTKQQPNNKSIVLRPGVIGKHRLGLSGSLLEENLTGTSTTQDLGE